MSNLPSDLNGLNYTAKRELLARMLREKAKGADETFPLSPGQEHLWFSHELAPESAAYNIPFCVRFKTRPDSRRLEHSFEVLLQRYPILRCTIASDSQGLKQRVGPMPTRCLDIIDASGWSDEELRQQVNACYRRPFNLSQDVGIRCTLFTGHIKGDVLLLSVHHIVFDAWSLGVLLSDLAILYDGGEPGALPAKSASYAEFVNWQRRMINSPKGKDAWNYWSSKLQNVLTPVLLPSDRPRPSTLTFRGTAHRFEIPAGIAAGLRQLSQAEGATPFAVLATAFHALLHRYTGAAEIPIGTPLAGRSQPEFEHAVGYFVNPIVLNTPISADTTFRQHLAAMRETIIAAQEHGDFPLIELVRRIRPERDKSRTPLFQVMLNLIKSTQIGAAGDTLHADGNGSRLGSLEFEAFSLEQQTAQNDIDLMLWDTGSAMPASLICNSDLFDPDTAARLANHFLTLLTAAIETPDRRIADLPILTQDEQTTILTDWNATARAYPDTTIHQLIEEQVRRSPEADALVFEDRSMSYRELNYRANQLANYLRGKGVGPDTLVAVCLERSFEMVIALLGILKSGGAYVPVDPGYPASRQEYMIRDADAPVILTQAKFIAQLSKTGSHVLALDESWHLVATQPGENLGDWVGPDHLAYSIYTSGSTGQPKGALNTHRGVCNRLLWMQDEYQLTSTDCVLQKTPFSFDVSVWEFFWPLMTGARLVLASPDGHKDPDYLVRLIQQTGVTTLHFVPSMLRIFLAAEGLGNCTTLKRVICSGEALSHELQERFFEFLPVELHNLYGPTEAAVDVTYWACQRFSERKVVPIGRPVANTQVYVLDGNMQPVPVGVPGELYLGGVQVGRGYWRRPELTNERFIPDHFRAGGVLYRTGDLVRWLRDGVLEYLGRLDQQVKVRGLRIELGEIESVIAEDPRIKQAVVIAREDVSGDQRLVAYVAVRNGERLQAADIRERLSSTLPEYMVPSDFVQLDSLPLSPNGKVDRKALPKPDCAAAVSRQLEPPQTEVQSAVASIWETVLRLPHVGPNDNFFDLGGHSLLAASVISRVRERYSISLPLRTIFEAKTVAAFASRIETVLWASRVGDQNGNAPGEREEFEL